MRATLTRAGAGTIFLVTLAGCASTQEGRPSGQGPTVEENTTRLGHAARTYWNIFNPIKWQKQAIADCGKGDVSACVATPVIAPFVALVGVIDAPLVFPLLLTRPCPQPPRTPSGDSSPQPANTNPPGEGPGTAVTDPYP